MTKYLLITLILCALVACKTSEAVEVNDEFSEEEISDSMYMDDEFYMDEGYDDFLDEEETGVRGIYKPSRTLLTDLIHTKLEVRFNWAQSRMNGRATISAKQHFYPSDSLVLDAKGMDILKIELNGSPLVYTYRDSLKLSINLGKTYKKDEVFTVIIEYVAKPDERQTSGSAAITSDKGLYFINPKGENKDKMPQIWTQGETEANSVWFPTIDAPNAKTTQEIFMTVDKKYSTLSNGKLLSSKQNEDGTRTDHWKQDQAHAPYLFMMAVGEFVTVKDSYTRQNGTKMDVNYMVEPSFEKDARAIFGETPAMIKYFSDRLGVDYPWDKYSQIVVRDYVSGAMENTGAVIFGDYVYKTDRELLDNNDQSTIAHELFHHWFGDLVTCESWANLPLNESFANYAQYLWDEHRYGLDEADYQAESEANGYFESAMYQGYHNLIWFGHDDKEEMFDGHSYNKGGRILHMLRSYLGDDAFFKGLNNYLVSNKYKSAEVHQLRLAFEEVSGEDLNWFFDQWFLSKGHAIIHTNQTIDMESNTVTLHIMQKQITPNFPVFRIPVKIAIWDANGKRTEKIIIDSLAQSFTFKINGELQNMLFDEDQMLLGKYYEDKPINQFVHQYYHSERYKARLTALNRASKRKTSATDKLIFDAMSDKHWDIRMKAIEVYTAANKTLSNDAVSILKNVALKDPKSSVRSIAIKNISASDKTMLINLCKNIISNDQSYSVISTALEKLVGLDSTEGLNQARILTKISNAKLTSKAADILGNYGTREDYAFLENLNLIDKPKGEDELNAMVSYTLFIIRQEIDLQEKSLAVYSYLNDVGNQYTKMWLSRAVNYTIENYTEKSNNLESEIAEAEMAKNTQLVAEKKRLKQRYDDLITNLSPMVVVEEEGY
jgi:aminopeptidase N